MKPARVGSALYLVGALQCPRCGRRDLAHLEGIGIFRPTCTGKRCRASWTAVRLPPGCTGRQLIDVIGPLAARIVLVALDPQNGPCSDMELEVIVVPGAAQEALYVQRAPDTPEPLMGWRQAQQIMNSLMGPDDQQGAA